MNYFFGLLHNKNMLTLIIRAVIVYLLVLVVFRLMGKRQIGQMQPFELVLTLVIADLATIPMAESSIPTLNGVVPLITLVVVHFFLTFFSKKSLRVAQIISGKPVIIIDPNGINFEAIDKLDISVDDVFEAIHNQGYFRLEEVQYAIMETNGVVNVMPKASCAPLTVSDVDIVVDEATLPITVISDGNLMEESFAQLGISKDFVEKMLKKLQIKTAKDVVVLTIDKAGACYLQEKNKAFRLFDVALKGSGK